MLKMKTHKLKLWNHANKVQDWMIIFLLLVAGWPVISSKLCARKKNIIIFGLAVQKSIKADALQDRDPRYKTI